MKQYQNRYIFSSDIMRRQKRAKRRMFFVLAVLLFLVLALFMGNIMTSHRVVVEDLRVTVLNLPKDLEEYSILHISDLHGARYGDKQRAIASALGARRYSAVVITGDVLGPDRDINPLLELIALMPKETPKYYIPGDVDGDPIDYSAHGSLSVYTEWAEQMIRAGVTILDRPVSETRKKGTIWFIPEDLYAIDLDGLETTYRTQMDILNQRAASLTADDAARIRATGYQLARIAEIRELKTQVKPEDIQIVLTHTPLSEEYVSGTAAWSGKGAAFSIRYASMILACHYNGGQWRLPFGGAIYVPELGWFPEDAEIMGLSYVNGVPQYISPGLGSDPHYNYQPGRLFNHPVITRITLTRYEQ